nr:unnamed protein product [Callosobruchus chinensis]
MQPRKGQFDSSVTWP